MNCRQFPLMAAALLAACSSREPAADASATPSDAAVATATPQPASTASPAPSANAPVVELKVPARFRATGTEPFWGAAVDGTALTYSTPEYPDGIRVTVTRKVATDAVSYSGTIDGKPIELTIGAGPCSDGMSDTIYPFTATRTIGPDIERGCAR